MANGDATFSGLDIRWRPGSSACVVLASRGYPSRPQTGDLIEGLDQAGTIQGVEIFHAGTAFASPPAPHPSIVTSGGRVLGVTATADTLDAALAASYQAVGKIRFDGMQYRRDIGTS
jgi:phosphoribosylamine--glycine ligase